MVGFILLVVLISLLHQEMEEVCQIPEEQESVSKIREKQPAQAFPPSLYAIEQTPHVLRHFPLDHIHQSLVP